jgi:hypothetical protein
MTANRRSIVMGQHIPVGKGRATLLLSSKATDGRYRGWLYRPDGTKLENILVRTIGDADARASALVAKGKL